jgi:inosine-uridine nucleoside N-ribohydrolase
MKFIIDTDIGSDADDALALAYALKSGIEVALVTTVHGDTRLRGSVAKKFSYRICDEVRIIEKIPSGFSQHLLRCLNS